MIREKRSREKLEGYYNDFIQHNTISANVHPWVADSWQKSRKLNINHEQLDAEHNRLIPELFKIRQAKHRTAISYVQLMSDTVRDFMQKYNISMLLLDPECIVLRSYFMPFYQLAPGEVEGVCLGMEAIGTSSVSIAYEHRTPFWMFGPEMWIRTCQSSDACSAPIIIDDKLKYIVTFVAMERSEVPQDAIVSMLLLLKSSLEAFLRSEIRIKAHEAIIDATPFAVYHVLENGEIDYANKLGWSRLNVIGADKKDHSGISRNLNDVILNYSLTPIYNGFKGKTSINKEFTWITKEKTYEDITTAVPLAMNEDGSVHSVVAATMPIEDLRALVAHAAGFTSKYSLESMVTRCKAFMDVKNKAYHVAANKYNVLLEGESGVGKHRMAHGIHQASKRAAGPFIALNCGETTTELLEQELFGIKVHGDVSHPGKLELASGGTLFIDEIEKIPLKLGEELAAVLSTGQSKRINESVDRPINVRIIAACDGDLKRIAERQRFSKQLYNIVSKGVLRLPALKNRREDIGILSQHIIMELADIHSLSPKEISREALEILMDYSWPGNIKQLQDILEKALCSSSGKTITAGDIDLLGGSNDAKAWKNDKKAFEEAWKASAGNISKMANMLGVSRVTLYRYLKKYHFTLPRSNV